MRFRQNLILSSVPIAGVVSGATADSPVVEIDVIYPQQLASYSPGLPVPLIFGYNSSTTPDIDSYTVRYSVSDDQNKTITSGSIDKSNAALTIGPRSIVALSLGTLPVGHYRINYTMNVSACSGNSTGSYSEFGFFSIDDKNNAPRPDTTDVIGKNFFVPSSTASVAGCSWKFVTPKRNDCSYQITAKQMSDVLTSIHVPVPGLGPAMAANLFPGYWCWGWWWQDLSC